MGAKLVLVRLLLQVVSTGTVLFNFRTIFERQKLLDDPNDDDDEPMLHYDHFFIYFQYSSLSPLPAIILGPFDAKPHSSCIIK